MHAAVASVRQHASGPGLLWAGAALSAAVAAATASLQTPAQAAQAPPPTALSNAEFRQFKLIEKEKLTHNTYRLRFGLPEDQTSGLFVASCLVTRAVIPDGAGSKAVVRPYTPTSPPNAQGYLDLVVKTYPQGKMSKHVCELKVGDELEMKGPIPKLPYTPNMRSSLGMVAGGTGITPMLQVIDAVLNNPKDYTTISLVYANVSPKEIILKEKLDKLAARFPHRFQVYYVVDKPGFWGRFTWRGGRGYITPDMLKQHLPSPHSDTLVMVCGPPGMMDSISGPKAKDFSQGELSGALRDLGYKQHQVFKF